MQCVDYELQWVYISLWFEWFKGASVPKLICNIIFEHIQSVWRERVCLMLIQTVLYSAVCCEILITEVHTCMYVFIHLYGGAVFISLGSLLDSDFTFCDKFIILGLEKILRVFATQQLLHTEALIRFQLDLFLLDWWKIEYWKWLSGRNEKFSPTVLRTAIL